MSTVSQYRPIAQKSAALPAPLYRRTVVTQNFAHIRTSYSNEYVGYTKKSYEYVYGVQIQTDHLHLRLTTGHAIGET